MSDPPTLFDGHLLPDEGSLEDAFWKFHRANPHVYRRLLELARQWRYKHPRKKVGMKRLFEVLRWEEDLRTEGDDPLKLNNNLTSYYSRLIMAREPELRGLFETRRLHAAEPDLDRRAA